MADPSQPNDRRTAANPRNMRKVAAPGPPLARPGPQRTPSSMVSPPEDVVLPNEDPAAYQERLDQWLDYYQPQDPAQLAVIECAVSSKWKLDRCTRLETERLSEKVRHAVDQYDLDRSSEAETPRSAPRLRADGPHGRPPDP